ncbi:MAG: hypothetical protein COA49_07765 [Bacteroidetes bacterium]|nr:MAG: hypothetical protein COA49_07765 [Bacteroidota bacterium]
MVNKTKIIHTDLLTSVEMKFGKLIRNQQDVLLLKEYIFNETGVILGVNTLRRFFGLIESTNPNSKTLNTLSQYIGYKNHANFMKQKAKDYSWNCWERVFKMELEPYLSDESIKDLLLLKKTNSDYYLFLIYLVSSAFSLRQVNKLKFYFSNQRLLNLDFNIALRFGLSVGNRMRDLPESQFHIFDSLVSESLFRENIVYFFVDYSHLNGYYAILLKGAKQYEKASDSKVFINLMQSYGAYLTSEDLFEFTPVLKPSSKFPTLEGRYFGWMLLSADPSDVEEIFNVTLNHAKRASNFLEFFLEVVPALIFIKRIDLITIVVEDYYEKVFNATQWQHSTEETIYLIGKSLSDTKCMKLKTARLSLTHIDLFNITESYDDYLTLFYQVALYQILKLENESETKEMLKIEEQYSKIVERTGLVRFDLKLLKEYF